MIPRVCRATWAIVEVVGLLWATWIAYKIAKNIVDQ